jgi:hypothetical protein
MSGSSEGGPLTMVATLVVGILQSAASSRLRGAERRARAQAEREEREARKQRREWLEYVARQMSIGEAGDASQELAQEALRGAGGRPSKLDEEFF